MHIFCTPEAFRNAVEMCRIVSESPSTPATLVDTFPNRPDLSPVVHVEFPADSEVWVAPIGTDKYYMVDSNGFSYTGDSLLDIARFFDEPQTDH